MSPKHPRAIAVTVVTPPGYVHSQAFHEVAEGLYHALRSLGHPVTLTDQLHLRDHCHIILGANLLPGDAALSPDSVIYNLEQIFVGSPWLREDLLTLLRRYPVWDYNRDNVAALRGLGARALHVPLGYVPELTRIPTLPPEDEDIDVLFFGSLNPRRMRVLDALDAAGLRVQALAGVYGPERDAFIARARLCLNVHFYEARRFEIVRASYLLANRRCVVSETGADPQEEADLASAVAFAPYEDLVARCRALSAAPAERRAYADAGLAWMRARPQAASLRPALAETFPSLSAPL